MNQICGSSSRSHACAGRARRLTVVGCAGLALLAASSTAAVAAGKPQPEPQNLWRSYPLNGGRGGSATSPAASKTAVKSPRDTGTSSSNTLLIAWIAVAIATAGVLAAVILVPRLAPSGAYGGASRLRSRRRRFRREKGESVMGSERRRLWGRRESEAGEPQVQRPSERDEPAESRLTRISAYGVRTEPEEPAQVETPSAGPADTAEVAVAVSNVLKSAEEAAARMRRAAHADAAKIRDEAKNAVEAELAEAQRVRAETEAELNSAHAAASTFAQKLRSDAENEAQQMVQEARARLERADSEIERKLRESEHSARHRRQQLEAETERYHERLERMLGVVQAMSSQLEDLLAGPKADTAGPASRETLEGALQPGQLTEARSSHGGSPTGSATDLRRG